MHLDDYTLTELRDMLDCLDDMELTGTALWNTMTTAYNTRRAAKFLFLDLYEDVE